MDDVDGKYANPEYGGLVSLRASELDYGEMSADWAYNGIITGFVASGQFTASDDVERLEVSGAPAYRTEIALQRDDGHSADIVPVLDSLVIDESATSELTSE